MLIASAYAADVATPASSGMSALINFAPLVFIVIIFYFILIRPQQKQQKTLKSRLAAIRRGVRVVTAGGIIGTVAKAADGASEIEIDIAPTVRVTVLRSTITSVLSDAEATAPTLVTKKAAK